MKRTENNKPKAIYRVRKAVLKEIADKLYPGTKERKVENFIGKTSWISQKRHRRAEAQKGEKNAESGAGREKKWRNKN